MNGIGGSDVVFIAQLLRIGATAFMAACTQSKSETKRASKDQRSMIAANGVSVLVAYIRVISENAEEHNLCARTF